MNNLSISVVGANQGALAFSCFAAENGFKVTVFEKKCRKDVSYEWYDDMSAATFKDTGITCPSAIDSASTPGVTLVSPQKNHGVTITDEDNSSDIPVSRRELNDMLYERAKKAGVKFKYDCEVTCVLHNNNGITGIILKNGEEVRSDLTVDCAGAQSALRNSLPDYCGIPQRINPEDMFFVTRTYFNRASDTIGNRTGRRIYLKHLNERGISWCFPSHDGKAADVLIGRLGSLDQQTQQRALSDLRKENDIIGDTVLFGGYPCTIPVRRPISRMFADGYVLLGDSAYMTLPMNGSGMARSLYAAKMLAETISQPIGNPFDKENLYRYQVKYMQSFGKDDAPVELIKNWLLNSGDGDVDFLMKKGILNAQILGSIQGKPDLEMILSMLKSIISGMTRPSLLFSLLDTVLTMATQTKITASIPEQFNPASFTDWQCKYDRAYQSL